MSHDNNKTKKQLIDEIGQLRRQVLDISKQIELEKTLKSRDKQYRRAEEIAQVGSFVVDVSSGEMKWSDQVYRMLGLKPGEIKSDNESFWEFVHPEDRDRLTQETSRVFAGTADMDVQYRIVRKDGELRHVHTHADRELDGQGNLVYIWGFSQDITEARLAIEQLRESEGTLRALINAPTETAILINLNGTVLALNKPAAKRLGKKSHEMVGACIWDCFPEDLIASRQARLEEVALTGKPIRFQDERAGRIYDNNCFPVFDLEGKIKAIAIYASDITERKQAEESLRESEEKYRTLLESNPYGFEVIDVNGNILYSNPAYQKMIGFTEEELLGKSTLDLLDTDEARDQLRAYLPMLVKDQPEPTTYIQKNRTKDGKIIDQSVDWNYRRDNEGRVIGFASVITDVTERKRAEEEAQARQVQLDALLSNVDAIVLEGDPYNIYYVGGRVEELLGYAVEEWFDHPDGPTGFWLMHLHLDDRDKFDICADAISKGENHSFEYRMIAANGRIVWFHDSVSVETENGVPIKARSIMIDITKLKQVEEALRESEGRFRNLAEASHEGVGIIEDEVIVEANRQLAEMLGYTLEEFIGIPVMDLVAPESRAVVAQHMSTNSQETYEHMALKKDGTKLSVEVCGKATFYRGKQVRVAAVRDITETKRLQDLESRAERLETAGTIAGQVAHDFNNLLAPLMAYPDFIREELPRNHPALAYLNDIESSAKKIAEINQQLLTLGRRGHYNQEVLNLNTIIHQVVREMTPLADNVTFTTDLDPDLMNVLGGGSQIHRMVTNLLCNAVDALQAIGYVSIRTENYYVDNESGAYGRVPKGEYVKLTIADTGCGISEDIVQKILDPFFTTKTSDKKRGSGLGLSVVDAVVKDHGGYLDLETKPGKGTSFYVYFPTTRESLDDESCDSTLGGSETILVIDDDDVQREVSTQLLRRLGYVASTVESGEKAVEFLKDNPQDLLILDMVMPPGIDGTETYRRVLELSPNQRAIIVSGFSETERVIEVQSLGAGTFVKKPLTKKAIAAAVREELDRKAKVKA